MSSECGDRDPLGKLINMPVRSSVSLKTANHLFVKAAHLILNQAGVPVVLSEDCIAILLIVYCRLTQKIRKKFRLVTRAGRSSWRNPRK